VLYDRQRHLLALLDALGGSATHTDFQKLLFLYTRECETTPSYDFVPYKFGCFSFTSYADKRRLIDDDLLVEDELAWRLTPAGRQAARKSDIPVLPLARFCRQYPQRGDALIAETYRRFPEMAARSEILDRLPLDTAERQRIVAARPRHHGPGLLTIGYEGRSLEAYLNRLLSVGITLLCDVRRNPLSRKYGFSKSTLSKACEGVGIRYEHLPELGIDSEKRQKLETQADYDALFAEYRRKSLPHQKTALARIKAWITGENQRVALTCFELHPEQCHRQCVAEALETEFGRALAARHL
jgi:hypothetical protein